MCTSLYKNQQIKMMDKTNTLVTATEGSDVTSKLTLRASALHSAPLKPPRNGAI